MISAYQKKKYVLYSTQLLPQDVKSLPFKVITDYNECDFFSSDLLHHFTLRRVHSKEPLYLIYGPMKQSPLYHI